MDKEARSIARFTIRKSTSLPTKLWGEPMEVLAGAGGREDVVVIAGDVGRG